ncbi:MAG: sulfotransferase family 2 domain-containing protein [Cyanothece sp. SIO1E1]|nr:sulfotransferase family 2 domain-containing protein [Cyanothece sp. SIO1E1]
MNIKPLLQPLLRQNYYVTHVYHRLRLWGKSLNSRDKIVIYQMGKVGSTTIWKSLESLNLDIPVYHVHYLKSESVKRSLEKARIDFPRLRFIYPEVVQAEHLRNQLNQNCIETPWHVITLVRDPIAKMLSSFFQTLERDLLLGSDYRKRIKKEGYEKVLEEIISRFYDEYVHNPNRKHPFCWFDYELKKNLNIDIFNETPLSNKNYHIYNATAAKILLLKLESLSNCYQDAFYEFLGFQDFKLIRSNVGSQKRYGNLYKDFLDGIDLPVDYIDKIYSSDLVKHFYSDLEIEEFYRRWQSP